MFLLHRPAVGSAGRVAAHADGTRPAGQDACDLCHTCRMRLRSTPVRLAVGLAVALAGGLCLLLADAAPAFADGGRPSGYESVVDRTTPVVDGARVEVLGGDAFLQVTTRPGTEVVVPGYDGEPYLRISRSGVVEVNLRSPAYWLNQTLTGRGSLPQSASSSADPEWRATGARGRVAWHDHRIHWMVAAKPTAGPGGLVQEWSVPLTVNGKKVVVDGRLLYRGATVPLAELLLLAAAGIGTAVGVGRWARARNQQLFTLFVASAVALFLAWSTFRANPPDAGASLLPTVVAAVAMLLVAAAPGLPRVPLALASAATLIGWSLVRSAVVWSPVDPTTLPGWVDRLGTVLVLGAAAGVAYVLVRHPLGAESGGDGDQAPDGGQSGNASPEPV